MDPDTSGADYPVISNLADFDKSSGSLGERLIFNNRLLVVILCLAVTLALAFEMTRIRANASFERMIPRQQPYIANYLANKSELSGVGNSVRIAVETTQGTILNAGYLHRLQQINDEVFLLPGVDRAFMKSLWTPSTRWIAVTEEGLDGGTVIPDDYDSSAASLNRVRANIERSGEIGQLVAADYKSSIIAVPLEDRLPDGSPLDYRQLSLNLQQIREKYQDPNTKIHIVGFAKVAGDLIEGLREVGGFFLIALLMATVMVYWFNRDLRSTVLVVFCSLVAVIWQLGILAALRMDLDPYSMLVPFLVFAIGMSHGTQKMNGILQDIGRGTHRLIAARYTFRRLFVPGLTALLCDAVGFAVLMIIHIEVIQELAIAASIGVGVLIFTNLVLLPVLLSYTGVGARAAARSVRAEAQESKARIWQFLDLFTQREWATVALLGSVLVGVAAYVVSTNLQIGDLASGAPELRPDSRYNLDNAFIVSHYTNSSDVLVTMVKTSDYGCATYETQERVDALEQKLRRVPGVEGTQSLAGLSRNVIMQMNEGSPKWYELIPNASVLGSILTKSPRELFNQTCSIVPVFAYLKDHKAQTLTSTVQAVEDFASKNNSPKFQVLLAAGNAGIDAATNIVVKSASRQMLYWVYGAVILLSFVTFRSWRAVTAAVLPLVLTSILCEALMVTLGIGVKVATLPVIALGVGIGVDYALYVLSVTLAQMRKGLSLSEAYFQALKFTGKVVLLTGLTLGAAVATWILSPIKFQADLGILLAFMFVWNMLGALVLLPALAHFLLKPVNVPHPKAAEMGWLVSTK
jgi:predicted RND superfamily exporter protein